MPFKHQTESYRTRNGIRYENDGDVFGDKNQTDATEAKSRVQELRGLGRKAFAEKHDGYHRVFVQVG